MSEFISIKDAKAQKKGDFVGTVTKVSDLNSGTGQTGDWTLKVFTIQDKTDEIEFLAWKPEERDLLKQNCTYEFINPWYKIKKDKVVIQGSQFGKINPIKTEIIEEPSRPVEVPKDSKMPAIPELNANIADLVSKNTVLMMQIEKEVRKTMREFISEDTRLNDQQVGLYVKENFRDVKSKVPDHD